MKRILTYVLVSALVLQGCSAFRPHTQVVNVSCEPEGSLLLVNGERYDSTAQVEVQRNRDLSLQCSKAGYFTSNRTIGYHMSGTGVLDTIGIFIFLLPGIGLFTPGAWELNDTDISIQLHHKQQGLIAE